MKTERVKKYLHSLWKEWRIPLFFIVFVVIPVKSSLADWNWVPTGSMNPTILEGDLIYVDKIAYDLRIPLTMHRLARWSDPERGDIVICFSPEDGVRLVKRVVGLPGDTIEMKNNTLFLNGKPVGYTRIGRDFKELPSSKRKVRCVLAIEVLGRISHAVMSIPSINAMRNFGPVTVPQGSYFVLGDNRDSSRDSRYFGFVDRESIIGKAKGVIGSFDITDKYQPRFGRFFESLN
ncbi:MAG: signal peptidase I [Sedimentisphaerales bacterium]|nr:signal peptidase I [Sedimentisphaerales bacterium]